ncbi:hypothetical protein [Streptacidiphilus neutrinimicus]|uniref:hypothetical protein n=1 Tax=Streptacidiphilus neutrinimicus TaxID=105420 RepID=UPI0006939493|nr:hypothetical protein [Streptacidiphilus neutrinimicus]
MTTTATSPAGPGNSNGNGNGHRNGGTADAVPPPVPARYDPEQVTEAFDARMLKEGQLDELTHRLIGPLTRLLRMELRFDRERAGRLRDNRR